MEIHNLQPPPGGMPLVVMIALALGFLMLLAFVLGLLVYGIKNPVAWMVVAILFITIGVGCLVWALNINTAVRDTNEFPSLASLYGSGCGGMVGGTVLFWVARGRRKKGEGVQSPPKPLA
jgi:hypothetical protein